MKKCKDIITLNQTSFGGHYLKDLSIKEGKLYCVVECLDIKSNLCCISCDKIYCDKKQCLALKITFDELVDQLLFAKFEG